jgi:hypothetical protein
MGIEGRLVGGCQCLGCNENPASCWAGWAKSLLATNGVTGNTWDTDSAESSAGVNLAWAQDQAKMIDWRAVLFATRASGWLILIRLLVGLVVFTKIAAVSSDAGSSGNDFQHLQTQWITSSKGQRSSLFAGFPIFLEYKFQARHPEKV